MPRSTSFERRGLRCRDGVRRDRAQPDSRQHRPNSRTQARNEAPVTAESDPKGYSNPEPVKPRRRAVAYLRMSTEHQEYSTQNQIAAIERYAAENDMELVATYSDEARSGLRLREPARHAANAGRMREAWGMPDSTRSWSTTSPAGGGFRTRTRAPSIEYACQEGQGRGSLLHGAVRQRRQPRCPTVIKSRQTLHAAAELYSRELSNKGVRRTMHG